VTLEARLGELDALLREAVARMRRQDDAAVGAATALALVEKLTGVVQELGEAVAVLCWAAQRVGLNFESARMEMFIGFARSEVQERTAGADSDREDCA